MTLQRALELKKKKKKVKNRILERLKSQKGEKINFKGEKNDIYFFQIDF